jgi:hypothetical protein
MTRRTTQGHRAPHRRAHGWAGAAATPAGDASLVDDQYPAAVVTPARVRRTEWPAHVADPVAWAGDEAQPRRLPVAAARAGGPAVVTALRLDMPTTVLPLPTGSRRRGASRRAPQPRATPPPAAGVPAGGEPCTGTTLVVGPEPPNDTTPPSDPALPSDPAPAIEPAAAAAPRRSRRRAVLNGIAAATICLSALALTYASPDSPQPGNHRTAPAAPDAPAPGPSLDGPSQVSLSAAADSVTVQWHPSAGAVIQYAIIAGPAGEPLVLQQVVSGTSSSATLRGLAPQRGYCVQVAAVYATTVVRSARHCVDR